MAYTVLARRYRPMSFSEVVGQDHVTVTLINALKKEKVAHAYLFAGPRGIGKTTTARILAKAVNCTDLKDGEPCNKCSTCTDINDGRSLDILEIDGASNRGIDEIRNLRENVKFAPSSSTRKVYIIDEVHQLTSAAFNALLKTLEEPPSHVLFIFATTEAHQVLPTILSRCQRFDFHRISAAVIRKNLEDICLQEKVQADDHVLDLITRKADGGLRDAQSLLDQLVAFCGETLQAQEVEQVLGLISWDTLFDASQIFRERDTEKAFGLCDRLASQGADYGHFLRELAEHLVRLLRVKTTESAKDLEVGKDVAERYEAEAATTELNDVFRWMRLVQESEVAVRRSPAPRVRFETDFMKIATLDNSVDLQSILSTLSVLEAGGSARQEPEIQISTSAQETLSMNTEDEKPGNMAVSAAPETAPSAPAPSASTEPEIAEIRSGWGDVCKTLKGKHPSLGVFLAEGYPKELDGSKLVVVLDQDNGFHIEKLRKEDTKVREAIKDALGMDVTVQFVSGQIPGEGKPGAASSEASAMEKAKQENPVVKDFLDRIDGQPM